MGMTIIDAHSHLWLYQDTEVEGLKIQTMENGQSLFMGEVRQMLPPFMIDGRNSAEVFLANMNYAQVGAAVVTQEYIDGIQNEYLLELLKNILTDFLYVACVSSVKMVFTKRLRNLYKKALRELKFQHNASL